MISEYVVGKIIRKELKENGRTSVIIEVNGKEEVTEHDSQYSEMFDVCTEVICVWRPEFKKITSMHLPSLWKKIAETIELPKNKKSKKRSIDKCHRF